MQKVKNPSNSARSIMIGVANATFNKTAISNFGDEMRGQDGQTLSLSCDIVLFPLHKDYVNTMYRT
jgi:hypothetical protein